jgi:hypothetical protein
MLSKECEDAKIVELPKPQRNCPNPVKERSSVSEKEAYCIDAFKLTGPEWVRLLSLLCSVVADDEYSDLEVAKRVATLVDKHLQDSPKFQEEMKKLCEYGGTEVQHLMDKLKLPPWER